MPVSRKSKKTKNSKTRQSSKRSKNIKRNKKTRVDVRKMRGGGVEPFNSGDLQLYENYTLNDDRKIYTFTGKVITHDDKPIKEKDEENLEPDIIENKYFNYDRYRVILRFLVSDPDPQNKTPAVFQNENVKVHQELYYKLINFTPITDNNVIFRCPECLEILPENWEYFKHNPTCIIKDSKPYPYDSTL